MTEQEAVRQLKRGDVGGLEHLVQLYAAQALRVSYLVSHDYATSEDIAQEAFLRAYECIDQFDAA
ncbi:MAG: hypothetical protein IVW55_06600 [Chloroflexi bacterium]|nr:hypothetical protein [Chloroflexota bacterium]